MQKACAVILMSLLMNAAVMGQKRKKPRAPSRSRSAAARTEPSNIGPRMVGSTVIIITKNDDRIVGTLVGLTSYSVRIKADNLESTISLDRIASLSFGNPTNPSRPAPSSAPLSSNFARDAGPVLDAFQRLAEQLRQ